MALSRPFRDPNNEHRFPPVQDKHAAPGADAFLQFLVNLVNNGSQIESIGVTLQMGGMLVSGSIVSGAEYFDRFAASFTNSLGAMDAETRTTVHASLAELGDVFRVPQPADPLPNYIHLSRRLVLRGRRHACRGPTYVVARPHQRGRRIHLGPFAIRRGKLKHPAGRRSAKKARRTDVE